MKKTSPSSVKTLIITDLGWGTGEEAEKEGADIAKYMLELHGIELDYTHVTAIGVGTLDEIKPDLIIMDYGGAHGSYGNHGYVQVDAAIKWAQEHPSKLLLVYTQYTLYMVEDVMDFKDLPDNVLPWSPDPSYTKLRWDKYQEEVALKIRHWYGIPEPEEPDPEEYKIDLNKPGRG